jgi:3D (Asp-Asp-Asp) domain-containing protein
MVVRFLKLVLAVFLLTFSCQGSAFAETKEYLGRYKVTFYWVVQEADKAGERTESIFDMQGRSLGKFSKRFVRALKMEGSAVTNDGRVLNVSGRKDGTMRFQVVSAPYGLGSRNNPLVPFRSIATDPKVIPYGTVLYIPKAVGAKLPDGSTHDGYFMAADCGGGIKGLRLDLFTGLGDQRAAFTKAGVKNLKEINLFKVTNGPQRPVLTTPAPAKAGEKRVLKKGNGVVRVNGLNVRKGPGTDDKVIEAVDKGTRFKVLGKKGDWLRVKINGKKGWLHGSYVDLAGDSEQPVSNGAPARDIDMTKRPAKSLRASRALARRSRSMKSQYLHYRKLLASFGYKLDTSPNERTVIGLRGLDPQGRVHLEGNRKVRAYNGTFVVIWIDDKGKPRVAHFAGATTPGQERTKASGTPDPNKDGVKDIAHLSPGVYRYKSGTFKGLSAYRPISKTPCYRDTNHDGRIDKSERKASKSRGDLATGILFHRGRDTRPSSVGCQTMNPKVFDAFEAALGSDKRFDYVLIDPR